MTFEERSRFWGRRPQSSRDALEILPPAVYGSPNRKRSYTRYETPFFYNGVTSASICTRTEALEKLSGDPCGMLSRKDATECSRRCVSVDHCAIPVFFMALNTR